MNTFYDVKNSQFTKSPSSDASYVNVEQTENGFITTFYQDFQVIFDKLINVGVVGHYFLSILNSKKYRTLTFTFEVVVTQGNYNKWML